MTARIEARLKHGRDLRDRLRAEKRHVNAQVVDDLCRSLATSNATNRTLHRDLQDARRAAGLEAFVGAPDRAGCDSYAPDVQTMGDCQNCGWGPSDHE